MVKTQELILVSLFSAIILILAMVPNLGLISFGAVSITIIHIPVLIGAMSLKRVTSVFVLGLLFGLGTLFAALTRGSTPFDLAFINPLISVIPRILFALIAFYLFKGSRYLIKSLPYIASLAILSAIMLVMSIGLYDYLVSSETFNVVPSVVISILIWVESLAILSAIMPVMSIGLYDYLVSPETFNVVLSGVISILIWVVITAFMYVQTKKRPSIMFIPLTSLVATLLHTVLVLSALVIVEPSLFNFTFGVAVNVIYGIMISNGLLEAVVAVFVVTPVVTALYQLQGNE